MPPTHTYRRRPSIEELERQARKDALADRIDISSPDELDVYALMLSTDRTTGDGGYESEPLTVAVAGGRRMG